MSLNDPISVIAILFAICFASNAHAADACCHHCGCPDGCEKVCRLVREDKKVNVTCWGCKCEDFCAPGKSCRGCKNCEEICVDCDSEVCSQSKDFVWYDWEPGCAKHIYTKKKLMKRTETKTVPSFKWVVEDLCGNCRDSCPYALIPPGSSVPEPPLPGARIIPGISLANAQSGAEVVQIKSSQKTPSALMRALFGKGG